MCNWKDPLCGAKLCIRISFGLSLLLMGLWHYMTLDGFVIMVSDGLGPLTILGTIWAYILPALMIVGGALLTIGKYDEIGSLAAGIALGSIAPGLLLKPVLSGISATDVMPMVVNTFIWLLVYAWVVKTSCCCNGDSCGCGDGK